MLRRTASVAILLAAALTGCVQSHAPSESLARFCDELFDAMCDPLAECACGARAEALCRARGEELCAGYPSEALLRSIEEGRLVYDEGAAAALLERMRARGEVCESFLDAVDWRVRDLFTAGGVFSGTVPAGEPCDVLGFELISECALGSCASIDGASVCRTSVGAGEACDATHRCADLDAPVTDLVRVEDLSQRCVYGWCVERVAGGGACATSADCASGLCLDARCVSRASGEACESSRECASGWCSAGACAEGGSPNGSACDEAAACASRACVAGECLPAGCSTF